MKNLRNYFILFILVLIASCSKDSDPSATTDAPIVNLAITNISPTTGPKNTPVTITGTGFSTTLANNTVTINGKVCTIISTTATQMNITIPPSAGSGKIRIVVGDANAESNPFDYILTATVSTFAGSTLGFNDGQGVSAQFNSPRGMTINAAGELFVVEESNHSIRKISPSGIVTTVAGGVGGFADGQGTNAKFLNPRGITIDNNGNLFVVDRGNNRIRKITNGGNVTTVAGSISGFLDGESSTAKFSQPTGIAIDALGNLYVVDRGNEKIRKISTTSVVSTIAGSVAGFANGQGINSQFSFPTGIVIDSQQNLFITDSNNFKIRKISASGLVSTFAGSNNGLLDGQGVVAQFKNPIGIAIDALGNLFVTEFNAHKIRKISSTGFVTTLAGKGFQGFADGIANNAQFNSPDSIILDPQGNIFISEAGNHRIRKITFD